MENGDKVEFDFQLTIYSDKPVEFRKLDDTKCSILTGNFDENTAGGS